MSIELLCAKEATRLLSRNLPKYTRTVGGLYLLSAKDAQVGHIARASYFFFRNLDDALDGDRPDISNPTTHVASCRQQIVDNTYTGTPQVIDLAKFSIEELEQKVRAGDNPRQDFVDEIDVILFDYYRASKRRTLTDTQINQYYQETFFPVVNLMLIGLNSNLRAVDIPEFSYCQGRVYSVRDLDTDWPRGVINIPAEVLEQAHLTTHSSLTEVRQSKTVRQYFHQELMQCQRELPILEAKLAATGEYLTQKLCLGLAAPLYRLSRRYIAEF